MPKLHSLSILLFALVVSGCVSRYQEIKTENSATLMLSRGATYLGGKSLQEYDAYRNESCQKAPGTGRLAAFLTYGSQSKSAKVEPDRPVYLMARTSLYGTAPRNSDSNVDVRFYLTTNSCTNLVRFTPDSSGSYDVRQEVSADGCTLIVRDSATNRTPVDLVIEDARTCAEGSQS